MLIFKFRKHVFNISKIRYKRLRIPMFHDVRTVWRNKVSTNTIRKETYRNCFLNFNV